MGKLIEDFIKLFGGSEAAIKAPQKKWISIMSVVVAVGILMIFLNNLFGTKTKPRVTEPSPVKSTTEVKTQSTLLSQAENQLAQNLEELLSQIQGVGKVTARVNLKSSPEYLYAFNSNDTDKTTEEKDTKGASRTITEVTKNGTLVLIKEGQTGKENPVIIKEVKPEVDGVIVIAQGADDEEVKAELYDAVATYFHLPAHKITVKPMKDGEGQ